NLWEHPPVASAKRHVEFMGGAADVLAKARRSYDEGDFRWVAQVLNYVIFADPDNTEAKALQADTLEQLGYGSENGTWRNFFLMGAYELRNGSIGTPLSTASADIAGALTVEQVFDALALRVDGPGAWDARITIDWRVSDQSITHRAELRNGLLVHFDLDDTEFPAPDVTITLTNRDLHQALLAGADLTSMIKDGSVQADGDIAVLSALIGHLDSPDPDFAIVTP
ncbi:MAG: MBL fold metallo-hydrolase, partial [Rhodococcus sp.]|nr:MBL fold metallo-hydrolase [Rhodococcus sp. (in: high G+C Gram-positive bacteria)]